VVRCWPRPAGSGFALSLFDAKGELARLSHQLVNTAADKIRGLGRFSRTERLAAAHTVLVLAAYSEAMAETNLLFDVRELSLDKKTQLRLAGSDAVASNLRRSETRSGWLSWGFTRRGTR
jgi:hypothetical protein